MLKNYHFSLGNSSKGPVGFCAVISAESPEAAVVRLQELLPPELNVADGNPLSETEYVYAYFNAKAVTVDDIDSVDVDEPEPE